MNNFSVSMQKIWDTEQEILDIFDAICQKHQLRYTLGFGTLLGAVRHGGFIPWDDDIDLLMPREDYERFLALWPREAVPGYLLQNTRSDADFTQNFTKIRKDHTTFLQEPYEKTKHYQKGFFIDIFPMDRVPAGKLSRAVQYAASAVNLLYSRGFSSGSAGIIGFTERFLLRFPRRWQIFLRDLAERPLRHWNGHQQLPYVSFCQIQTVKTFFTPDFFSNMTRISFAGKQYSCTGRWKEYLTLQYGDYMQLPPKSEQVWSHHPIVIDFEHNYEELRIE